MKRLAAAALCLLFALLLAGCGKHPMTEERARERLIAYAHAVDYDYEKPEKIYPFLCASFKERMTKKAFCEAFKKERSYPYITPLYFYDPTVEMNDDMTGGTATYLQAARIIGMTYTVDFVYENGDYYIIDWEEFPDGSYLEKFDTAVQTLDWYYSAEVGG